VRLDDDAFVNIKKLRKFLARVNASKPWYIGSPGFGRDEGDKISAGENYCMVKKSKPTKEYFSTYNKNSETQFYLIQFNLLKLVPSSDNSVKFVSDLSFAISVS